MVMNNYDNIDISPKRKIGMTRRSVSGVYVFRNETGIPYESTLERDFLIRSEIFLNVLHIVPQPIRIPFTGANGRGYTYTPDFLVMYRAGKRGCRKPALVEVKPSEQWRKHWRNWRFKWKAAISCAKEHGWSFHIQDESRIRDIVLKNIRFLDRYKRMRFMAEDSQRVIGTLNSTGPTSICTILDQQSMGTNHDQGIMHLWHLVATRELDCNITCPLDHHTRLWVPADE